MKFNKLITLADIFSKKATGATTTAQAADVEDALTKAGLWNISNQVAPMLTTAQVPNDCKVSLGLAVDKSYNISFIVVLNPSHDSSKVLSMELKKKFGDVMKKALMAAKLNIADTITVKWLTF
jgi:hypothetical protein